MYTGYYPTAYACYAGYIAHTAGAVASNPYFRHCGINPAPDFGPAAAAAQGTEAGDIIWRMCKKIPPLTRRKRMQEQR